MIKSEFFNVYGDRLVKSETSLECNGFLFPYPEANERVAQFISDGYEAYPINEIPSDGDDSNDWVDVESKNDLGYSPFKYGYLIMKKRD